jgi:hypothetical protein
VSTRDDYVRDAHGWYQDAQQEATSGGAGQMPAAAAIRVSALAGLATAAAAIATAMRPEPVQLHHRAGPTERPIPLSTMAAFQQAHTAMRERSSGEPE